MNSPFGAALWLHQRAASVIVAVLAANLTQFLVVGLEAAFFFGAARKISSRGGARTEQKACCLSVALQRMKMQLL